MKNLRCARDRRKLRKGLDFRLKFCFCQAIMTQKAKRTNREMQLATQRFMAGVDSIARILSSLFKWGTVSLVAYWAFRSIECLSGKITLADVALRVLGDIKINQWLCYALAGGASVWALGERRLRRKKVAELAERVSAHERVLDKARSSSTLPSSGQTRKDDES